MFSKSKLNSIETLISQALIDIEISHEEYITILKKKDNLNSEKYMSNNTSCKATYKIMRLSSTYQRH